MKKSFEIIGKNRKALNLCLIIANLAVLAILGFVLFQRHNTKSEQVAKAEKTEQVANSTSSSSEKAKEDDETQLKKGSNHSIAASDYAYDVTAVNNTIRGQSQDIDDKVVFLTFDDGIDPTLTPQVMDILITPSHKKMRTSSNAKLQKGMRLLTIASAITLISFIQDVFLIKVRLFLRLTKPWLISKPS